MSRSLTRQISSCKYRPDRFSFCLLCTSHQILHSVYQGWKSVNFPVFPGQAGTFMFTFEVVLILHKFPSMPQRSQAMFKETVCLWSLWPLWGQHGCVWVGPLQPRCWCFLRPQTAPNKVSVRGDMRAGSFGFQIDRLPVFKSLTAGKKQHISAQRKHPLQ